jgi:hypothetical protein
MLFRASRPQRISVTRMWFAPSILMVAAGFLIYSGIERFATPAWTIAVAVVLGLAAGIPVGILRGHHTDVKATDRHGVMLLGASWATALIYMGAFGLRFAIKAILPMTSPLGAVVGDGLLIFAIAIIGTTYFVVFRKYEALDHRKARVI